MVVLTYLPCHNPSHSTDLLDYPESEARRSIPYNPANIMACLFFKPLASFQSIS